jgi:hypothetical protein
MNFFVIILWIAFSRFTGVDFRQFGKKGFTAHQAFLRFGGKEHFL